jgi:hypothetical protein
MSIGLHVKYRLILSYFNLILTLRTNFRKKKKITKMPNFIKFRPVRAELLHADRRTAGWTDTTKLIVSFRNFANAP